MGGSNKVKVIRNDRYIERRGKIARYTSGAALIILLAGMVLTWVRNDLVVIAFVCLLIGFILSMFGIYYGNRFARPDRPDVVLTRALKGLDDRYYLYHYSTPTPHLLLGPDACYVFSVHQQTGKITARGKRWKQSMGWRRILLWMGQESISDPTKAADAEVEVVERFLDKHLPGVEVPLTPVILFSDPNVELDASDTRVPVVHIKKLKDWLRGEGKGGKLSAEARKAWLDLFGRQASPSAEEEK